MYHQVLRCNVLGAFLFFALTTLNGCSNSSNDSDKKNQLESDIKLIKEKTESLEANEARDTQAMQNIATQVELLTRENNALKNITNRALDSLIKANSELAKRSDKKSSLEKSASLENERAKFEPKPKKQLIKTPPKSPKKQNKPNQSYYRPSQQQPSSNVKSKNPTKQRNTGSLFDEDLN